MHEQIHEQILVAIVNRKTGACRFRTAPDIDAAWAMVGAVTAVEDVSADPTNVRAFFFREHAPISEIKATNFFWRDPESLERFEEHLARHRGITTTNPAKG